MRLGGSELWLFDFSCGLFFWVTSLSVVCVVCSVCLVPVVSSDAWFCFSLPCCFPAYVCFWCCTDFSTCTCGPDFGDGSVRLVGAKWSLLVSRVG